MMESIQCWKMINDMMIMCSTFSTFVSDFDEIKDPIKKDRLTKCATLAIRDYNSQTQNDYQLVVNDEFISQMVNVFLYRITFQAMNADKEYASFEAHVYGFGKRDYDYLDLRKIFRIRMQGTSTW
jgi:hypothetical protein